MSTKKRERTNVEINMQYKRLLSKKKSPGLGRRLVFEWLEARQLLAADIPLEFWAEFDHFEGSDAIIKLDAVSDSTRIRQKWPEHSMTVRHDNPVDDLLVTFPIQGGTNRPGIELTPGGQKLVLNINQIDGVYMSEMDSWVHQPYTGTEAWGDLTPIDGPTIGTLLPSGVEGPEPAMHVSFSGDKKSLIIDFISPYDATYFELDANPMPDAQRPVSRMLITHPGGIVNGRVEMNPAGIREFGAHALRMINPVGKGEPLSLAYASWDPDVKKFYKTSYQRTWHPTDVQALYGALKDVGAEEPIDAALTDRSETVEMGRHTTAVDQLFAHEEQDVPSDIADAVVVDGGELIPLSTPQLVSGPGIVNLQDIIDRQRNEMGNDVYYRVVNTERNVVTFNLYSPLGETTLAGHYGLNRVVSHRGGSNGDEFTVELPLGRTNLYYLEARSGGQRYLQHFYRDGNDLFDMAETWQLRGDLGPAAIPHATEMDISMLGRTLWPNTVAPEPSLDLFIRDGKLYARVSSNETHSFLQIHRHPLPQGPESQLITNLKLLHSSGVLDAEFEIPIHFPNVNLADTGGRSVVLTDATGTKAVDGGIARFENDTRVFTNTSQEIGGPNEPRISDDDLAQPVLQTNEPIPPAMSLDESEIDRIIEVVDERPDQQEVDVQEVPDDAQSRDLSLHLLIEQLLVDSNLLSRSVIENHIIQALARLPEVTGESAEAVFASYDAKVDVIADRLPVLERDSALLRQRIEDTETRVALLEGEVADAREFVTRAEATRQFIEDGVAPTFAIDLDKRGKAVTVRYDSMPPGISAILLRDSATSTQRELAGGSGSVTLSFRHGGRGTWTVRLVTDSGHVLNDSYSFLRRRRVVGDSQGKQTLTLPSPVEQVDSALVDSAQARISKATGRLEQLRDELLHDTALLERVDAAIAVLHLEQIPHSRILVSVAEKNRNYLKLSVRVSSPLTNVRVGIAGDSFQTLDNPHGIADETVVLRRDRNANHGNRAPLRIQLLDAHEQLLDRVVVSYDQHNGHAEVVTKQRGWDELQAGLMINQPVVPQVSLLHGEHTNAIVFVQPPKRYDGLRVGIREGAILGSQPVGNGIQISTLTLNADARPGTYHIDLTAEDGMILASIPFNWDARNKTIDPLPGTEFDPTVFLVSQVRSLPEFTPTGNVVVDIANDITTVVAVQEIEALVQEELAKLVHRMTLNEWNLRQAHREELLKRSPYFVRRDVYVNKLKDQHPHIFPADIEAHIDAIWEQNKTFSRGRIEEGVHNTMRDYLAAFNDHYNRDMERITNLLIDAQAMVVALRSGTYTRSMQEDFRGKVDSEWNRDLNLGSYEDVIRAVASIMDDAGFRGAISFLEDSQQRVYDRSWEMVRRHEEAIRVRAIEQSQELEELYEIAQREGISVSVEEGLLNGAKLAESTRALIESARAATAEEFAASHQGQRLAGRIQRTLETSTDPLAVVFRGLNIPPHDITHVVIESVYEVALAANSHESTEREVHNFSAAMNTALSTVVVTSLSHTQYLQSRVVQLERQQRDAEQLRDTLLKEIQERRDSYYRRRDSVAVLGILNGMRNALSNMRKAALSDGPDEEVLWHYADLLRSGAGEPTADAIVDVASETHDLWFIETLDTILFVIEPANAPAIGYWLATGETVDSLWNEMEALVRSQYLSHVNSLNLEIQAITRILASN